MPTIKNIGKQQRMVVDRFLLPGDARYISPKRVSCFQGDPDFEIVDETPKSSDQLLAVSSQPVLLKVHVMDDEPLQAQPEVDPIDQRLVEAELNIQPFPTKRKAHQVIKPPAENQTTKKRTKKK